MSITFVMRGCLSTSTMFSDREEMVDWWWTLSYRVSVTFVHGFYVQCRVYSWVLC